MPLSETVQAELDEMLGEIDPNLSAERAAVRLRTTVDTLSMFDRHPGTERRGILLLIAATALAAANAIPAPPPVQRGFRLPGAQGGR